MGVQPRLIFKKTNFHLFHELGKLEQVQLEQNSKIPKSICELGKT